MELGEHIPVEEMSRVLAPVQQNAVQAPPRLNLRELAGQLPDLSNLENLTVNIQANSFLPPNDNSTQLQALANDTQAQLGHLRNELKHSLDQGTITISERFAKIGTWCQQVYNCQHMVHASIQEVHNFLEQIVANVRG
jgi:hypothetical protein